MALEPLFCLAMVRRPRVVIFVVSEAQEQEVVVQYCDLTHIPCFHIPNGGYRHIQTAYNLKKQGVKPGVPDLCIPVARGKYHGLYIEMKSKKGRLSQRQADWIAELRKQGYCAYCCFGAKDAITLIDRYMSL